MPTEADENSTAELIAYLHDRHTPCPVCAYDLHRVNGATCPECAAPLTLEIRGTTPRDGAWFVASVGVAAAMGFDSVVSLMLLVTVVMGGAGPGAAIIVPGFVMASLAGALVLRRLFTAHKWWAAQTSPQRWRGTWSILILTFILHVIWGGIVFAVAV